VLRKPHFRSATSLSGRTRLT